MLQTRKNKSESVINMSGTEPTNEQLNHDIATKVMGWCFQEGVWWKSGHYVCDANDFRPTKSYDDFMDAFLKVSPSKRYATFIHVVGKQAYPNDMDVWFTAPLRTKCLALLAAGEESP